MTTLLIVEDNREMRRLMRQIVEKICDRIYECDDGAGALDAYRAHRPDIVLMDVEMPSLNGIQATSQIISRFPHARVIIVTKHDNSMTRDAAEKAGACAFLGKDNLVALRDLIGQINFFERGNEK